MPISITPVIPPQAGAPVSLQQSLQPGAVLEARVLAQLDASLLRILIAGTAIDVATETPLPPGAVLRVEVSRGAEGGLRLTATPAASAPSTTGTLPSDALSRPDPATAAVAQAIRHAAPRQNGLSPLFADLAAALEQGQLPPRLRAAVAPLLAMRPELSAGITAPHVQKALQQSGLLLESSVVAGRMPQTQSQMQVPDMKAALIVLRQVLSQWQGALAPPARTASSAALPTLASSGAPVATPNVVVPSAMPVPAPTVAAPPLAPVVSSPVPLVSDEFIAALTTAQPATRPGTAPMLRPQAISAGIVLTMLQDMTEGAPNTLTVPGPVRAMPLDEMPVTIAKASPPSSDVPPPPYRGAPPSAQAVALAGVNADDTPPVVAQKLIEDVDGALARQTLLQIASLPDQPIQQGQRNEQPRWAFEIPFVTPQGTAVAQFEISRDGHASQEIEPAKRIWRARFSLNVEPAGPVHATISLTGERASVRLWADRPETIARLRDSTPLLSHALREAELDPGEITVGRPPQTAPVAAGQFWNQAS